MWPLSPQLYYLSYYCKDTNLPLFLSPRGVQQLGRRKREDSNLMDSNKTFFSLDTYLPKLVFSMLFLILEAPRWSYKIPGTQSGVQRTKFWNSRCCNKWRFSGAISYFSGISPGCKHQFLQAVKQIFGRVLLSFGFLGCGQSTKTEAKNIRGARLICWSNRSKSVNLLNWVVRHYIGSSPFSLNFTWWPIIHLSYPC